MNIFQRKSKKLSVRIGLTVGIEIFILLSVLVLFITKRTRSSLREEFTQSAEALIKSSALLLNQRNSRSMQQLRLYTLSDLIMSNDFTAEEVGEWLFNHQRLRYQDFSSLYYVDLETGKGYSDDGKTKNFSNTEYFKRIKEGSLSQYISNPIGTSAADCEYQVCKSVKKNGVLAGFFVATIGHEPLAKMVEDINIGGSGFLTLLNEFGQPAIFPDDKLIMATNFVTGKNEGSTGINEACKRMIEGNEGAEWVTAFGTKYLMVYTPVAGTTWSISFSIPAKDVYKTARDISSYMLIIASLIVLLLIATVYLSVYFPLLPLSKIEKNINEIASGNADLTKRMTVSSSDEVGEVTKGFNKFMEKLQTIMKDIKGSRLEIDSSGSNLTAGLQDSMASIDTIVGDIMKVNSQLSQQTECVESTARSVGKIAMNIAQLEQMIANQSDSVSKAGSAVEEMIGNIASVNHSVLNLSASFDSLEDLAKQGNAKQAEMNSRIGEIETQSKMLLEANTIIATIASQTNLLAMNAAIEAAHAGEAGKGFAVVADEIRKLSENSAKQSRSIGKQLSNIKNSINYVVEASSDTSHTFGSVTNKIHQTDELVKQIRGAMDEQQIGSSQIGEALENMSESTEEVKRASAEMGAGNEEILLEVQKLKTANNSMNESVRNMGNNTGFITETGSNLKAIVDAMKESITKISAQIDNFEV